MGLEEKLLEHTAPSLVAVIGGRDSGKTQLIMGLAQLTQEDLSHDLSESHYRYYHNIDTPIFHDGVVLDAMFVPCESKELKKLSFMEVRREPELEDIKLDLSVAAAEGILFLINAQEPWSKELWKQVDLYSESHKGKIMFCLTNVHLMPARDVPVLRKHLQERITQISPHFIPLKEVDHADLFTYEEIRIFLENRAVRETRWDELKTLKGDFQDAFKQLESALVQQRKWLEMSTGIATGLKDELFTLRQEIRYELLLRIESMGTHLKDRADEILGQVRDRLTTREYLGSLMRTNTSLIAFQEGLESILSEALYTEIGGHYVKTNELIAAHAKEFGKEHPFLIKFCPQLMGSGKELQAPFLLEKKAVNDEIHKVLRLLRLKPLFREELEQIDQFTNARLCLMMVMVIAAGVFGSFSFHIVGFLFLGLALLCGIWCFWSRSRALDSFVDFLDDWFLGVGPRLLDPVDKLSANLVNHAIDTYGNCFIPYLQTVKERQNLMPERLKRGRQLYKKNHELIQIFSEGD